MTVKAKGAKPVKKIKDSLLVFALTEALREIEAHHVLQNHIKGRREDDSKTLRIVRSALSLVTPLESKP